MILLKLQSNFIEITLRHGCSPVNLLHIFRTPFPRDTSGWLLLNLVESNFGKASKILIWISFLIQRMQIRFKLKLLGI